MLGLSLRLKKKLERTLGLKDVSQTTGQNLKQLIITVIA